MKVFRKAEIIRGLVDHPYDTNPELIAKVNFLFTSKDGKLTMAYYESPAGWFDVEVDGFQEIDYVLEGEVHLESENESLVAFAGDAFLIEDGDAFRWEMVKPSKMVFFIYPITKDISELIQSFYQRN
jgi:uncharacterized cupin superfamily protein